MMNQVPNDTAPSSVLRSEHATILRVVAVLERLVGRSRAGGGFEHEALSRCVEFFRLFADACHHAKEEDLLFPVLEQRGIPREGGPIGVMLYEHQQARQLTRQMGEALAAHTSGDSGAIERFHEIADGYIELLRGHIFKEDNILFPMGDRVMSTSDQSAMCGRFCEVGCRAFEGRTLDQLRSIADELESLWPA
jgi:hemerythrin-like domain-containing protein